jgi:hypothetical protein
VDNHFALPILQTRCDARAPLSDSPMATRERGRATLSAARLHARQGGPGNLTGKADRCMASIGVHRGLCPAGARTVRQTMHSVPIAEPGQNPQPWISPGKQPFPAPGGFVGAGDDPLGQQTDSDPEPDGAVRWLSKPSGCQGPFFIENGRGLEWRRSAQVLRFVCRSIARRR